jgi:hypothetical protein
VDGESKGAELLISANDPIATNIEAASNVPIIPISSATSGLQKLFAQRRAASPRISLWKKPSLSGKPPVPADDWAPVEGDVTRRAAGVAVDVATYPIKRLATVCKTIVPPANKRFGFGDHFVQYRRHSAKLERIDPGGSIQVNL